MTPANLTRFLSEGARSSDRAIRTILRSSGASGPLKVALDYSLFPGGKRFRPTLCVAVYQALGGGEDNVWLSAASLELAHNFTLVQDDLPSFDNDNYRRGKLTVHKKFGDSTAVLVSDILLLLAFRAIAMSDLPDAIRSRAAVELADGLGAAGVIGGQHDDLKLASARLTLSKLLKVNRRKTGALMKTACRMGALMAGAKDATIERMGQYGECVGMAFQIADDLADSKDEARLRESGVSIAALKRRGADYVKEASALASPLNSSRLLDFAKFSFSRAL